MDVINWVKDIWRWGEKSKHVQYTCINRRSNVCVDLLAKQAIPNQEMFQFYSFVPNVIHALIAKDYFDH